MIARELNWERDGKSLTEFDASFTTEYIYRPTVGEMSFELTREKLNIPLHKTYTMNGIESAVASGKTAKAAYAAKCQHNQIMYETIFILFNFIRARSFVGMHASTNGG